MSIYALANLRPSAREEAPTPNCSRFSPLEELSSFFVVLLLSSFTKKMSPDMNIRGSVKMFFTE